VAFANGGGGTIVFGVEDETHEVKGLPGSPSVDRRRINDFVRDLVTPSPRVRIESGRHDGRNVLVLHVEPGGGTIHALVLDANKPEYYVRRDGSTYYARPEDLATISAQGAPIAAPAVRWRA
jgi:ATP-dependent DNA helicase RecG